MCRKIFLALLSAAVTILLSITTQLAEAQTYVQRCVNGKCTWVLVESSPVMSDVVISNSSTVTPQFFGRRSTFSSTLLEVAESAYKDGLKATAEGRPLAASHISRLDMLKIRLVCRNVEKVKQLEAAIADQMVTDGDVASITAIDWSKWKELILTLLPIIIELIGRL